MSRSVPPLLEVSDLRTHFTSFGGTRVIKAVDGISFTLNEGETVEFDLLKGPKGFQAGNVVRVQ